MDTESAELALSLVPDVCIQLLGTLEHPCLRDQLKIPEMERLTQLMTDFDKLAMRLESETPTEHSAGGSR
jgi:hypothetical protein